MDVATGVWMFVQLGQFAVGQAVGDAARSIPSNVTDGGAAQSVWDFMVKGGPVMIPIGLCSFIALTVMVERLISLRRGQVIPRKFFSGLADHLKNGVRDRDRAMEYCKKNGSPVANIVAAGIKRLDQPVEVIEKHITEAGQREVLKLRKYTRILSVIASIAPLLGLLGTIFGMITAFQTVAASGEALGKTELLAKGIYQAMITTAAGLMVAIPVLIGFHWLAAKIEFLVSEMDRLTVEFVETYAPPPAVSGRLIRRESLSLSASEAIEDDAETDHDRIAATTAAD